MWRAGTCASAAGEASGEERRERTHPQVLHHQLLLVVVGRRLPHKAAPERRAVVAQEHVFVREVLRHQQLRAHTHSSCNNARVSYAQRTCGAREKPRAHRLLHKQRTNNAYDVAQLLVDLIWREVPLNAAFAQQLVAVGGEQLGALGLWLESARRRARNWLPTAHIRFL